MNTEIFYYLTKRELIIRCKELNIKGYSNKKRDELIEMILTKKQLIIRLKELDIKGYTEKKNDEIIVMIKETEKILQYEQEQLKKREEELEKELKVYNIVCLKCNLTLEPHTKEQHLDRNHEIHRCDTHHKMIKKIEICDCCVKGWNRANKFGLCSCICSKCKNLLRDCKYTCTDKIY